MCAQALSEGAQHLAGWVSKIGKMQGSVSGTGGTDSSLTGDQCTKHSWQGVGRGSERMFQKQEEAKWLVQSGGADKKEGNSRVGGLGGASGGRGKRGWDWRWWDEVKQGH